MRTLILMTLAQYMAGEFENSQQALNEPIWYVNLRLWLRPVPQLFFEDSVTLFAEQANVVNLNQPYRPRLLRLKQTNSSEIVIEHYKFLDILEVQGAGADSQRLTRISAKQIELLPTCSLIVNVTPDQEGYHFKAFPESERPCSFSYQDKNYQVSLGYQVNAVELKTYDKGLDPETGQGIWGALMGPYCYRKLQDFSQEIPN